MGISSLDPSGTVAEGELHTDVPGETLVVVELKPQYQLTESNDFSYNIFYILSINVGNVKSYMQK